MKRFLLRFFFFNNCYNKFIDSIFSSVKNNWLAKSIINTYNFVSKSAKNVLLIHFGVSINIMMMNCFCGMVDQRKAFSLISSRDHYQRTSLLQISDTPWVGFEPAQNLSSDFVESSCVAVRTTTPRRHNFCTTLAPRRHYFELLLKQITNQHKS